MRAALVFLLLSASNQYCSAEIASTLRIEVYDGKEKCIGQDFDEGDQAVFKIGAYTAKNEGHSHSLSVTV